MNFDIGQKVSLIMPFMDKTTFQPVTIHGIDVGGLWIECDNLTEMWMEVLKVQTAPRTLIFFVPYHEITLGMSSIEKVSLREKAFGE